MFENKTFETIFWIPVHERSFWYIDRNQSIKDLSQAIPVIFACSGGVEKYIGQHYGHNSIAFATLDSTLIMKGYLVCEMLRYSTLDYKFLVRMDIDSILFDYSDLAKKINKYEGEKALIGNKVRKKERKSYIRGGTQALTKELVDNLVLDPTYAKQKNLDMFFSNTVRDIESEEALIDLPLFEYDFEYKGKLPAYHPHKKRDRQGQFLRAISLYEQMYQESLIAQLRSLA